MERRPALCEIDGVRCFEEVAEVAAAWGKDADAVADIGEGPGHVEGSPDGDAVAEMFGEDAGVVGEVIGEVAVGPASAVFEGLREIPVIEGAEGTDACFRRGRRRVGCSDRCPSCLARLCQSAGCAARRWRKR